jgi:hypothetical protein
MGIFKRSGYKKGDKVYVIRKAEYGRVEQVKGDGLIKVRGFKTGEMWVRATDIERGD